MINKIILASRSEVRKKILNQNGIICEVLPADIDENQVKESVWPLWSRPLCKRDDIWIDHVCTAHQDVSPMDV